MTTTVLPTRPHSHATTLTATDPYQTELRETVVWVDRAYNDCPRCHQPGQRVVDQCPVQINGGACVGGEIEEWDQRHGCGEWLSVDWEVVEPAGDEPTDEEIRVVATRLLIARDQELAKTNAEIKTRLVTELREALGRLAEPLEADETDEDRCEEVRTGSDTEPGVCRDGHLWLAWDYTSAAEVGDDTITVTEREV